MSMLTSEHDSIYSTDDPVLMKLIVGLLFITVSGYLVANINLLSLGKIGRPLLLICLIMTIWRLIAIPLSAGILSYAYQPMRDLLIVILFMFGYIISLKSKELFNFYTTGTIIAILITAIYYYKNWTLANEVDEAHLGTAYYVLFLLPMILGSPKQWIKHLAMVITGAVIISSFKRGGLIAYVLGIVAYLYVKEVLLEHKFTKLIWFLVVVVVLFVTLIFIDNAMGNIITQRILNIQEDGGSGRNLVWITTWDMICNSTPEQLIFGHGINAVLKNSPLRLSAHNDFLEVLYNYGVICFIPYIFLHTRLIQQIFASIRIRDDRASIMAFTYTILIILSMISHVITYPLATLIALSWGLMSTPKTDKTV